MRFRNTLILLGILLALSGYIFFLDRKGPVADVTGEAPYPTALPAVLSFDPAQVRAISISRPDSQQSTELAYNEQDKVWTITAPVQEEADSDQIASLLGNLSGLEPSRILSQTADVTEDYGLNPPQVIAKITLADNTVHTIQLGARTPSNSNYYAQVDDQETIYLLPLYLTADIETFADQLPVRPASIPITTTEDAPPTPPPPTATLVVG